MMGLGTAWAGPARAFGRVAASAGLALVSSTPAWPGAWPRDKGLVFLSTGVTAMPRGPSGRPGIDASLYAEAGIGRGWMLGLDTTRDGAGSDDLVLGLGCARPLANGAALGWALGIGRRRTPGAPGFTYLRPALAWGRGFAAGARLGRVRAPWAGWISAEIQAELWLRPRRVVPKLDLTLGLNPGPRWAVMLELWADAYPGAPRALRLGPAVVARFGTRRLKLQPEIPLRGGGDPKLKLALWSEF